MDSTKRLVHSPDAAGPVKLVVHCAACGKLLGSVSNEGWVWTAGAPARLVNRRRLIVTCLEDTEPPDSSKHASPPDDFRMRTAERTTGSRTVRIWEYPYTCNADACTDALGEEWNSRPAGPPFTVMPHGKILC